MNKLVQTWGLGERSFPSLAGESFHKGRLLIFPFPLLCHLFYHWVKPATLSYILFLLHVSYISFPYTFTFRLYKITWLVTAENILCPFIVIVCVCKEIIVSVG
jgi:hypothetical protein